MSAARKILVVGIVIALLVAAYLVYDYYTNPEKIKKRKMAAEDSRLAKQAEDEQLAKFAGNKAELEYWMGINVKPLNGMFVVKTGTNIDAEVQRYSSAYSAGATPQLSGVYLILGNRLRPLKSLITSVASSSLRGGVLKKINPTLKDKVLRAMVRDDQFFERVLTTTTITPEEALKHSR